MLPYWLLFGLLALASLIFRYRYEPRIGAVSIDNRVRDNIPLLAVLLVLTLMIGLRYKVGGDWAPYEFTFKSVAHRSLSSAISQTPDEFAYTLINWLVAKAGFGIWLVNVICAVPFVVGLAAICRQQPNPWLALLVAAPLFIIVVGMGYTRQAVAAGFILIGVAGLTRGRSFLWFVGWTLVASAFHTSALLFIPMMAIVVFRVTFGWLLLLLAAGTFAYYFILPTVMDRYSTGYIHSVYEAKGAIFRIIPNALAGLLLIGFPTHFASNSAELKVWRGFAWASIAALIAFFIIESSVIIDRISVYILPVQIFVLSRLPRAFSSGGRPSVAVTLLVIIYSGLVLLIWLAYANNARFWVPYRLYPVG